MNTVTDVVRPDAVTWKRVSNMWCPQTKSQRTKPYVSRGVLLQTKPILRKGRFTFKARDSKEKLMEVLVYVCRNDETRPSSVRNLPIREEFRS